MTSLKEVIARMVGRVESEPDLPDPGFDYRVYWTKQAMGWSAEQRERIHSQVSLLMSQPDFKANRLQRVYHLEALDDHSYAGASIVALDTVLRAFLKDE